MELIIVLAYWWLVDTIVLVSIAKKWPKHLGLKRLLFTIMPYCFLAVTVINPFIPIYKLPVQFDLAWRELDLDNFGPKFFVYIQIHFVNMK